MQAEVVGDIIILNSGGHLELKGKVISNLFLHKGTCRMMWGIIRGNLENEMGDVEVFGTVLCQQHDYKERKATHSCRFLQQDRSNRERRAADKERGGIQHLAFFLPYLFQVFLQ
jgi:hypothetical protein